MSAQEQVNHAILQAQASEARKKKAQATYDQALAEDSSVFEYDGVYDAMQEKRAASAQTRKEKEAKREPSIDGLAQPSISTTAHGSLGIDLSSPRTVTGLSRAGSCDCLRRKDSLQSIVAARCNSAPLACQSAQALAAALVVRWLSPSSCKAVCLA